MNAALSKIRELSPLIAEYANEAERERRLARPVVTALIETGVFKLLAPPALGGAGATAMEFREVVEAVSAIDGSTGWCVMIAGGFCHFIGLLQPAPAHEIFGPRDTIIAGTFRPNGIALPVAGGFSVSGQWPLASGCSHATWMIGGCRVLEGGQPRLNAAGRPEHRLVFLPVDQAAILDTWQTGGLRGTSSHDFVLRDCFVPEARTCQFRDSPTRPEPLFRLNPIALFATFVASVSVGIARHALELFVSFSAGKIPTWSQSPLSANASAQSALGRAEGLVQSGRAFLTRALENVWATVSDGSAPSWQQRGDLFLASTQAATHAVQAVELLYGAAGASAVYSKVGFERCLRDVSAAAQHIVVTPTNFELAGQLALGMDVGGSFWSIDSR